jgi:hypothetical protein
LISPVRPPDVEPDDPPDAARVTTATDAPMSAIAAAVEMSHVR